MVMLKCMNEECMSMSIENHRLLENYRWLVNKRTIGFRIAIKHVHGWNGKTRNRKTKAV